MMTPDYRILPLLNALTVTKIEVVFTPTAHLEQKAWLGAAVRNRFLTACEKVSLPDGKTLREAFDVCPLSENHFLYKQYCNGFPKCFVWDVSSVHPHLKAFRLETGRDYRIKLFLFGNAREWIEEIKKAIREMMELGLGAPPTKLLLSDIIVHEPVRLEHFAKRCYEEPVTMTIKTNTPLSLFRGSEGGSDGYQAKLNGFPSLYQLVKSSVSRLAILNILYAEDKELWDVVKTEEEWKSLIGCYSENAIKGWLQSVELKQVSVYSTPKQEASNVYHLNGYIGDISFSGVDVFLIPVIKMMSTIGVGNEVSYGLGFYNITIN